MNQVNGETNSYANKVKTVAKNQNLSSLHYLTNINIFKFLKSLKIDKNFQREIIL